MSYPPGDFLPVSEDIMITAVTLSKHVVKHVLYINIFLNFFLNMLCIFIYIYIYISPSAPLLAEATEEGTGVRNEQCDTCSESHPAFVAAGFCETEVGLVCSIISGKFHCLINFHFYNLHTSPCLLQVGHQVGDGG